MITRFKKQKKEISFQSWFFSLFILGVLLVIVGILISSNLKINQKRKEFKVQIDSLEKEIQILEEKNQELKTKIAESEKEDYLEKEAREKLGLKKPGEQVVVVLPPKEEKKEKKEKKEEKNTWQNFFEKIKKIWKR